MSERLHYFTPDSSAISVSFDTDGSVSSDVESIDAPPPVNTQGTNPPAVGVSPSTPSVHSSSPHGTLAAQGLHAVDTDSRRPYSPSERSSLHAQQLQLWSDEARRRRSFASHTRHPSAPQDIHHLLPLHNLHPHHHPQTPKRSSSAKSLRIRITPSSSSKSLLSDYDQDASDSLLSQHPFVIQPSSAPSSHSPSVTGNSAPLPSPAPSSASLVPAATAPAPAPAQPSTSVAVASPHRLSLSCHSVPSIAQLHVPRPYVPPHDDEDDPVTPDPDSVAHNPLSSDASDASAIAEHSTPDSNSPQPHHYTATSHSSSPPDGTPSSAVKRSRLAHFAAAARNSKWSFLTRKKY